MTLHLMLMSPFFARVDGVAILMGNIKQFIISHMVLYSRKLIFSFYAIGQFVLLFFFMIFLGQLSGTLQHK